MKCSKMPCRFDFQGKFEADFQSQSVPESFQCLVSMLLNGPGIKSKDPEESQASLTIAQLIIFNMKKRRTKSADKSTRHHRNREPPLPVYIGLTIHAQTRSKKLINQMNDLNLSIRYNRVDEILNGLGTSVCKHFETIGVLCPLQLKKGFLTVGAIDNLDHNPSSTTSKGSFHGTGISLFQFPTGDGENIQQAAGNIFLLVIQEEKFRYCMTMLQLKQLL